MKRSVACLPCACFPGGGGAARAGAVCAAAAPFPQVGAQRRPRREGTRRGTRAREEEEEGQRARTRSPIHRQELHTAPAHGTRAARGAADSGRGGRARATRRHRCEHGGVMGGARNIEVSGWNNGVGASGSPWRWSGALDCAVVVVLAVVCRSGGCPRESAVVELTGLTRAWRRTRQWSTKGPLVWGPQGVAPVAHTPASSARKTLGRREGGTPEGKKTRKEEGGRGKGRCRRAHSPAPAALTNRGWAACPIP